MYVPDDLFEASFLRITFSIPPGLLVTLPHFGLTEQEQDTMDRLDLILLWVSLFILYSTSPALLTGL